MSCKIVRDPMGRMVASICTSGRRGPTKKLPCYACRTPSTTLCDGPPPDGAGRKSCDRPICRMHSEHLDGPSNGQTWDSSGLDLCHECRKVNPLPLACAVGAWGDGSPQRGPVPQACDGPVIPAQGVCWRHLKLWARWLRAGGWDEVYAKTDMASEAKRARFIEWLDQQPADAR